MSDLFVTDHVPQLNGGRALRCYAIIRALAALGPVDVLYPRFGGDEPSAEYLGNPNIRLHQVDSSRGVRRALTVARARLAGAPPVPARVGSPELLANARRLAPVPGSGRVIADTIGIRMALRAMEKSHGVILNAHNLESSFQDLLGEEKLASSEKMAAFEKRLFERSVESWMVSSADVDGARALAPTATIRYVPNVVDVAAITPTTPPAGAQRALLAADYLWPPNREAVAWLRAEVMPRVWAQLPQARLALAGRGLQLDGEVDPRIEQLGFVDELPPEYRRASCVLVPLLTSGGSPLKFVEGLAYGLPVVATSTAAQGLELVAGTHYVEGDGAEEYAAALVRVLRDGAPEVAAAGRALAERAYSVESLVELLRPGAPTG